MGSSSYSSPFTPPISGTPQPPISILLINPNSTSSMTHACLASLRPSLPESVTVTGFTPPRRGPSAIESATDAVLSAEACIRALAATEGGGTGAGASATAAAAAQSYDAMLVACYSKHPLIDALRELYDCPVVGIMEASLYVSRMLGGRFGIVATSERSVRMQDGAVAAYGLGRFYAGSEATRLGVLELERGEKGVVLGRVKEVAGRLVREKGADCVALGCAGMTEMVEACREGVKGEGEGEEGEGLVNVVDGVVAGVHLLVALVRCGFKTSKRGVYKSSEEGRKARGQDWL